VCFSALVFSIFINNLCNVIKHAKYLLCADNIKIFRALHSVDDRIFSQSATESEQYWCLANCMKLNSGKHWVVPFTGEENVLYYTHKIWDSFIIRKR
jgi:hypothetical protein